MVILPLSKDWRVLHNKLICDVVPNDTEHFAGDECSCVPLRHKLQHYKNHDDIIQVWVHRPKSAKDTELQQSLRTAMRLLHEYFSGIYHF